MGIFRAIRRFFAGPTPQEAYADGIATVDQMLRVAEDKKEEADHIYALADGAFNTKATHKEFDRGARDRLDALGYTCPYSTQRRCN